MRWLAEIQKSVIEYLGGEISDSNVVCFVRCVYNLHRCKCIDDVFSALDGFSSSYENATYYGDFNAHLPLNGLRGKQLSDLIADTELKLINSWPTRYAPRD